MRSQRAKRLREVCKVRFDRKPAEAQELRDLHSRAERIRLAAAEGVRAALRRHMLLGESVVVAGENGGVRWLGPEEIRRALEEDSK